MPPLGFGDQSVSWTLRNEMHFSAGGGWWSDGGVESLLVEFWFLLCGCGPGLMGGWVDEKAIRLSYFC